MYPVSACWVTLEFTLLDKTAKMIYLIFVAMIKWGRHESRSVIATWFGSNMVVGFHLVCHSAQAHNPRGAQAIGLACRLICRLRYTLKSMLTRKKNPAARKKGTEQIKTGYEKERIVNNHAVITRRRK